MSFGEIFLFHLILGEIRKFEIFFSIDFGLEDSKI